VSQATATFQPSLLSRYRLTGAVLLLVAVYLLFSPVWGPDVSAWRYDKARAFQLALLAAVSLSSLLPSFGQRLSSSWHALHPGIRALFAVLLGGGLVSALASDAPRIGLLHLALVIQTAVLLLVVKDLVTQWGEDAEKVLAMAIFAGAALVTLKFWVTYILLWLEGARFSWVSPFLDFANVRFFSQYQAYALFACLLPVALWQPGWKVKPFIYVVAANFWALQWMVGTRAVWIAFLAAVATVCILARRAAIPWLRTQLALVLAGALVFALFSAVLLSKPQATPIPAKNSLVERNQESIAERINLAKGAVRLVVERPWLGTGPGQFGFHYSDTIAAHPHNSALQLLSEYGVLAGGAAVLLCALLLVAAANRLREAREGQNLLDITLGASLVMGLVDALLSGNLTMPHSQVMFAVIAGWILVRRSNAPHATPCHPAVTTGFVSVAVLAAVISLILAAIYLHATQGYTLPFLQRGPNFWQYGRFSAW
jgi:O-antigen ligase